MCAKTTKLSPPPAEDATSASKVLGDDDLLGEILHRVDSPTSLVRAALVSKRWLRHASDRAFLRRFRERHPPRLLGFYVSGDCIPRPEFVPMPMPMPQPPELTAAVRRANFGFDAFAQFASSVWDCRNGRVLYEFDESFNHARVPAVRTPLRYPGRDMAVLPSQPSTWSACPHAMLLPDDDGGDASCYRVDVDHIGRRVSAAVSVLRSGAWTVHCSAWAKLARTPDRIPMITLLTGGKIYMVTVAGYILELDLAAASLFVVELPEGAAYEYYGNLVPCRGDDSVLYLFHVKGNQLSVWLRRMNDHGSSGAGASEWVLRDTISVSETCGHLVEQGSGPADGDTSAEVVGVGDNAEFVFLELNPSGIVVYMHLGSRRVEKVYQRDPDNDEIIQVHPFSMVWPPVFPAPDADEGGELHQE